MLVEDRILISAPPSVVWDETIHIDMWPAWAPTVQAARRLDDGPFGARSEACIKQPLQPNTVWRVVAIEDGKYFAWETDHRLFRMRSSHRIEANGEGSVCRISVEFIGPLARFFGPLLRVPIKMALRQENHGLKRWCEGRYSQQPPVPSARPKGSPTAQTP